MNNLIDRQMAIEALYNVLFDDDLRPTIVSAKQADEIIDAVRHLPTVERNCEGCRFKFYAKSTEDQEE